MDHAPAIYDRTVPRRFSALQRGRLAGADRTQRRGCAGGRCSVSSEPTPLADVGSCGDRASGCTLAVDGDRLLQDVLRHDHAGRAGVRKLLHRRGGRAAALCMGDGPAARTGLPVESHRERLHPRLRPAALPDRGDRRRAAVSGRADVRRAVSPHHLHVRVPGDLPCEHLPGGDRRSGALGRRQLIRGFRIPRVRGLRPAGRRTRRDRGHAPGDPPAFHGSRRALTTTRGRRGGTSSN